MRRDYYFEFKFDVTKASLPLRFLSLLPSSHQLPLSFLDVYVSFHLPFRGPSPESIFRRFSLLNCVECETLFWIRECDVVDLLAQLMLLMIVVDIAKTIFTVLLLFKPLHMLLSLFVLLLCSFINVSPHVPILPLSISNTRLNAAMVWFIP